MRHAYRRAAAAGLFALLWVSPTAQAEEGASALAKARTLARTERSWKDRSQVLALRIVDERGNERLRKMKMFTRREPDGAEKSLGVFLEPPEVRGTAFLQHIPKAGPSTQWLYLPELGRVRQISARARRKSFMGTDFSYDDLEILENVLLWTDADATASPLETPAEKKRPGRVWFNLRLQGDDPSYDRLAVELSEPDLLLRSMEMYVAGDAPTKILTFEDIRDVGGIPSAFRLELRQPEPGTHTTVDISDVEYDGGIDDVVFTKRALGRGLDHVD
ncbi:MAG: outer membrane lipoprotein-sorting protein [Candidatus Binatia bacterium]|nr:outer membrane lipoprotein-sorting protein [Candidatus Binatia bacterium]